MRLNLKGKIFINYIGQLKHTGKYYLCGLYVSNGKKNILYNLKIVDKENKTDYAVKSVIELELSNCYIVDNNGKKEFLYFI